jgi:hypothetical protein
MNPSIQLDSSPIQPSKQKCSKGVPAWSRSYGRNAQTAVIRRQRSEWVNSTRSTRSRGGPCTGGARQKVAVGAKGGTRQKRPFLNQLRTCKFNPCCSSSYGRRGDSSNPPIWSRRRTWKRRRTSTPSFWRWSEDIPTCSSEPPEARIAPAQSWSWGQVQRGAPGLVASEVTPRGRAARHA